MRRFVSSMPLTSTILALAISASPTLAADPPAAQKPETKKPEAKTPDIKPAAAAKPKAAPPAPRKPTVVDPRDEPEQKPAPKKPDAVPKKPAPQKPQKPLTPGGVYKAGDMQRPRPPVITPGQFLGAVPPPSDALVLFDGNDLAKWSADGAADSRPSWKIVDGYLEVPQPRTRGIVTRDEFGSCQIHLEWATPAEVKGTGQGRGNSGIMLHGIGEVQVLDSYQNDTYPDGQAAAIYSKYPPLVNASRKPGEWQTYDIVVELAEVDEKTKQVKRPARITVMHNGVIAQHASEVESRAAKFKLALQDHGNPVRYRNIWIRPLKPEPQAK